jgi:hypothetical protein
MSNAIVRQLDCVNIKTTKNVTYISDLPGNIPNPHGNWVVVGVIDGDVLISKATALVRIPISDVTVVSQSGFSDVLNMLKRTSYSGQKDETKTKSQTK